VVTGASGAVGRRAVAAFLASAPQVRAVVRRREAAEALRALGAKVAVTPLEDVEVLEAVMRDAHTVCHLAGRVDLPDREAYDRANVRPVLAVLRAARRAGVRRFLLLSVAGASPEARNPYLRSMGLAEEAVRDCPPEHVVVRSTFISAPGIRWLEVMRAGACRRPAVVVGSGRQSFAPVAVGDVVRVLVAADDRERVTSGTWGLEGPDRVTADELATLLAGGSRPRVHLPPWAARVALRGPGIRPGPALLDLLARGSVADAPDASAEFGVTRTPLAVALAACAGRLEGPGP
jgi:uncharacterized protein YbjT (DUF2867 family)